jgi:molybdenum cofactor biosynthesis enzyme MoaA
MPFSNITVNPSGSVAPCCKYNLNKTDSSIDGETLYTKNLQELFYQPAMEKIRQEFLNDREPEGCKACWDEEGNNITSIREHRFNLAKWHNNKERFVGVFEDPKIVTLDLKFSTLCNLKCRICGPYCSSNWLKESLDTGEFHEHTIKIFSNYSQRKFADKEENFDIFQKLIPNLHTIEFHGGEPLMQPEHKKIMKILDSYPNIEDYKLDLFYNTNGTQYDPEIFSVWSKMGVVELNISIDDIFDRFEYQRHPAKWNEVLTNIKNYRDNCSKNVNLSLYCTVNLYNIFYIDELIKFNANNLKCKLKFNLLHWPDKMCIKHLPLNIKHIIRDKIQALDAYSLSFVLKHFNIKEIISFMLDNEGSSADLSEFIKITNLHDNYRNESFAYTFFEYWNLLNDAN